MKEEKNHVGRPTNEEVRIRRNKKILRVLMSLIIIVLGVVGATLFFSKNDNNKLKGTVYKLNNFKLENSMYWINKSVKFSGNNVVVKTRKDGYASLYKYIGNNKFKKYLTYRVVNGKYSIPISKIKKKTLLCLSPLDVDYEDDCAGYAVDINNRLAYSYYTSFKKKSKDIIEYDEISGPWMVDLIGHTKGYHLSNGDYSDFELSVGAGDILNIGIMKKTTVQKFSDGFYIEAGDKKSRYVTAVNKTIKYKVPNVSYIKIYTYESFFGLKGRVYKFNVVAPLKLKTNVTKRYTYKKNSSGMYFELIANRTVSWAITKAPSGAKAYYKIGNQIVHTGKAVGKRSKVAVAFDKPGNYTIRAKDSYGNIKTVSVTVVNR